MVFLEHRPHVYYSLTTAVEATAQFVQQHVKGAIIVHHVTPPHGTYRQTNIRTRTTTLPRYATPTRGKKGQTDRQTKKQTDVHDHYTSLYAARHDDCERTATVALPTAASGGFISGDVGISAASDAFSTGYELPLTRFKKGQTDRQTNKQTDGRARSLYLALRCASREVMSEYVGFSPPPTYFLHIRCDQ